MSDKYKYTKDGRKVIVVGKVNSEEHIVREIFVSGDKEFPAGENFVEKVLLDAPAQTWKEKTLKELDERFDEEKAAGQKRLEELRLKTLRLQAKAELKARALFEFCEHSRPEQIELLIDYLAGRITHVFFDRYDPRIIEIDDNEMFQIDCFYGGHGVEELKLVSLMGKSKGDLSFRLHQYSDGSGGGGCEMFPCRSYEHAVQVAQGIFDGKVAEWVKSGRKDYSWVAAWRKIDGLYISPEIDARCHACEDSEIAAKIGKLKGELEKLVRERDAAGYRPESTGGKDGQ